MAWRQANRAKVQKVTPNLIGRFKEMTKLPQDRSVKQFRLNKLRKAIESGEFRGCEFASVYIRETDTTYQINGKHTAIVMAELLETDPSKLADLEVFVSDYEGDTLEDGAHLYYTFDPSFSAKTAGDINWSFAAGNPELTGLKKNRINLAVTGMAYHYWEEAINQRTPEERAGLLLEHPAYVIWLDGMLVGEDARALHRSPVAAAMFRSYLKNRAEATRFWAAVRDATGTNPNGPDRVLNKYLNRTSVATGRGASSGKKGVCPREMFVKGLHAWNAWRRDKTTDLKYFPEAPTPSAV